MPSLLFWYVILPVGLCFGLGAIFGAPFLPVRPADEEELLKLSGLRAGQTLVDLGSGDGRLLRAAARRGIKAIGYEINPLLFAWSWLRCLAYRSHISVRFGNFWKIKLPPAQAIYIFLIDRHMQRLDQKLTAELTQPTKVVSYIFEMPDRKAVQKSRNAFVYLYGTKQSS